MVENGTISSMVRERITKYSDKAVLSYKENGAYKDITWEELGSRIDQVALGLMALGIVSGDRVCLMSENCPEWVMADLGIINAGAINVPIYHTNVGSQISYIVNNCDANIIFADRKETLDQILAVRHQMPQLKKIIVCYGWTGEGDEQIISFQQLLSLGTNNSSKKELNQRRELLSPEDIMSIVYTSGTTGNPKGVMLTHKNFMSNVKDCYQIMDIRESDTCLSFLPLSHVLERTAGYYLMLFGGVRIAFAESFQKVPNNLLEVKPELVVSVPRLYEKMYENVKKSVADGSWLKRKLFNWALSVGEAYRCDSIPSSFTRLQHKIANRLVYEKILSKVGGNLRYFVSGGAPLAKEIGEFFYKLGITIYEGYGLTETAPVLAVNTAKHLKFGTVGPPLPSVKIKISQDGEILANGPNVAAGYYKNEQATRESFKEGWFYTGDIGMLDGEGFLRITDRKKDMIVTSGGKNVAPQNIENLLKSDKYISQVFVYGDKRKYLTALIVLNSENIKEYAMRRNISFDSLEELAANRKIHEKIGARIDNLQKVLASYEQIKKFKLLIKEFSQEDGELTPTLKIKRKVVTKKYSDLLDSMYNPQDVSINPSNQISPVTQRQSTM